MLSSDDDSGREESPPAQSSPTTIVETPSATVSPASTATGSRRSPRVLPPTPSTPRRSPRDHVRSPRNSTATSGASPAASNPAKKKKESGGDAAGKRGEGDCESTSSDGDTDDSDYVPDGQSSSGSSRTASPHAKKKNPEEPRWARTMTDKANPRRVVMTEKTRTMFPTVSRPMMMTRSSASGLIFCCIVIDRM